MAKAMTLAVIIVFLVWIFGGLGGLLIAWALAPVIGAVIWVIAHVLGWFNEKGE